MSIYRKTMSEALREVDEMKLRFAEAKYELYHKDFSSAMQHAYHVAKKHHGITIDPKEIDAKVATGPSKPSEGKTNTYRLKGDKGAVQVQVYNKGGSKPFELNMYKEEVVNFSEEVDLDEGTWALPKTPKEMAALKKLLSKPLKAKDASDKLYDIIGDDEMSDDLDDYADKNPNDDIRPMVKSHMKRLGIKEEVKALTPTGEYSRYREEVELDESVIDKVKEIASKKSAAKIDGTMVDSFTASAISQIYDKVNDANKKKMDGLPIIKLATLAMKMMQ